jgi:hypothetical protein
MLLGLSSVRWQSSPLAGQGSVAIALDLTPNPGTLSGKHPSGEDSFSRR